MLRQSTSAAFLAFFLTACVSAPASVAPSPGPPATDLGRYLAAEIDRFGKIDQSALPRPCRVLFVGSSSIVKWQTLASDMEPLPVISRGFGGSHIEYLNRWFDQVVRPYHPRSIVFYAGENDIAAGKTPERVVNDFEEFMSLKQQALSDTPVYFISLKPSKLRFEQLALQTEVNDTIRVQAKERADLHYIDVVRLMMQDGRPKDLFEADDLHMNAQGYVLWTQAVKAALLPEDEANAERCHKDQNDR